MIIKSTNYGEKFSLASGDVTRGVTVTVTPFPPPARRWNEVRGSIICDDGVASEEGLISSSYLRHENFKKK